MIRPNPLLKIDVGEQLSRSLARSPIVPLDEPHSLSESCRDRRAYGFFNGLLRVGPDPCYRKFLTLLVTALSLKVGSSLARRPGDAK